jgi:hypothetical protein
MLDPSSEKTTAQDAPGATIDGQAMVGYPSISKAEVMNKSNRKMQLWKWRSYGNHRTISTRPWKSRTEREIPTFPQAITLSCR